MKEIDARGLSCPAPVLETKACIEKDRPVEINILVDNEAAKDNVSRFLTSRGYKAGFEKTASEYIVTGKLEASCGVDLIESKEISADKKKIMVLIATDRMGFGDEELGKKLLINFIKTLKEMGADLWRLVFVNNGVKLTVTGSEILAVLKEYEKEGINILVCGTCLNHFNLLDQKEVGETTNMLDIVTSMQLADKVIHV